MKNSKLVQILQDGNIVIPIFILKNYKELKLESDEFLFLMYLYNKGNNVLFDPATYSKELNIELQNIMQYVSSLNDKNLLKVEVSKNSKGIIEEVISLDDFYSKLINIFTDEVNTVDNSKSNIFEVIEKEFGRTLSPIEYEIIKAWLDDNLTEELITEALKEATFNGVSNLRYIDKILYEWTKKGIKTKEDVLKNKQQRLNSHKEKEVDMDIMDWDWFDDE